MRKSEIIVFLEAGFASLRNLSVLYLETLLR